MQQAPQVGDTIRLYRPGMIGGGYDTAVISAAYLHEDDAYDAGYVVETGYPDVEDDFADWRVLATDVPIGQIREYAVVMCGEG